MLQFPVQTVIGSLVDDDSTSDPPLLLLRYHFFSYLVPE